jgi:hypothetical protein
MINNCLVIVILLFCGAYLVEAPDLNGLTRAILVTAILMMVVHEHHTESEEK